MRHTLFPIQLLFIFTLYLGLIQCNKSLDEHKSQEIPQDISYHSQSPISRTDDIRIKFTKEVTDSSATEQCFSILPDVKGKLLWENPYTLLFRPSTPLASNKSYQIEIGEGCLSGNQSYAFKVQTYPAVLSLDLAPLQYQAETDDFQLQGTVNSLDYLEKEKVSSLVEIYHENELQEVKWVHSADGKMHTFMVQSIAKRNERTKVDVLVKSASSAMDASKVQLDIPAKGPFTLLHTKLNQKGSQRIDLVFSNAIDREQDLRGLIGLSRASFTTSIHSNILTVYPSKRIEGEVELFISSSLKDYKGTSLRDSHRSVIVFERIQPQLRWVGDGRILPQSGQRLLPFEAVSLTHVEVEIIKYSNQNMWQFYSQTSLTNDRFSHREGERVLQKKIALNELGNLDTKTWNRYSLDLGQLFEREANALYQVRIGFRPSYADIDCDVEVDEELPTKYIRGGYEREASIFDVGYRGFGTSYNWQERDNPCHPSYYNTDRFIRRNMIAADYGLLAKEGEDRSLWVCAVNFLTADPEAGVDIVIYDKHRKQIANGRTNANGWYLAKDLASNPVLIESSKGTQLMRMEVSDGMALSMSQFRTSGSFVPAGIKSFFFGERDIWRPGDTIHLFSLLHSQSGHLPKTYPIRYQWENPKGKVIQEGVETPSVSHFYRFSIPTSTEDQTGNWTFRASVGGQEIRKAIAIETIKPNRIVVEGNLKNDDTNLEFTGTAKWLQGMKAKGIKVSSEVDIYSLPVQYDDWPSHTFEDPAKKDYFERMVAYKGSTNEQGVFSFSQSLPDKSKIAGRLGLTILNKLVEPAGGYSIDIQRKSIDLFNHYVGVKVPQNRYGYRVAKVGQENEISVICVDANGKPRAKQTVVVGLYKVNNYYWWDSDRGNYTKYNSRSHETAIQVDTLITDAMGVATTSFQPNSYGAYMVRAIHEDGHCGGDFFYGGYWGAGASEDQIIALPLAAEQEELTVGEEMVLHVPGIRSSRILVSIENGSRILQTFWIEGQDGDQEVRIPTSKEMAPGVYVHITQIQAIEDMNEDMPLRRYGVTYFKIVDPDKLLRPVLETADKIRPKETCTITVSEETKKPMAYNLMIVDEGLLSLTKFQTPDPYAHFAGKEALGVRTFDQFDQVLLTYSSSYDRLLAMGGDGTNLQDKNEVNRFRPVVMVKGPFYLKKGESATHQFTMPNYFGRVRCMLVAGEEGAFGSTEKQITVKQDLMLTSTAPRVLATNEEVVIPMTIFAERGFPEEASLHLTVEGEAEVVGSSVQTIQIPGPGIYQKDFRIRTFSQGDTIRLTANANCGRENANYSYAMVVQNRNPIRESSQTYYLDAGESEQVTVSYTGRGLGRILEVSAVNPFSSIHQIQRLIRYPYGCAEQTTSAVFPQLYAHHYVPHTTKSFEAEIRNNVQAGIERLLGFQASNGGFMYWHGNRATNSWVSSYVGHFLYEASQNGFYVPDGAMDQWIDFQRRMARGWMNNNTYNSLSQSYCLFTLALTGNADLSAMNRMRENGAYDYNSGMLLAATYAIVGEKEVARHLFEKAKQKTEITDDYYLTYGSDLRNQSLLLYAFVKAGMKEEAAPLLKELQEGVKDAPYMSTQTTSFVLMAFSMFSKEYASAPIQMKYKIGDQQELVQTSNAWLKDDFINYQSDAQLTNQGASSFFVTHAISYQEEEIRPTSERKNIILEMNYKDQQGNVIQPSEIQQGRNFTLQLDVRSVGSSRRKIDNVALHIPIPSGWEIRNERAEGRENKSWDSADYVDVRDNEVNIFFTLSPSIQSFEIPLTASYAGRFVWPPIVCEAMYSDSYYAIEGGQFVRVLRE